ncbi:hypothetical protein CR513_21295, partial [Mucuna pruriens]
MDFLRGQGASKESLMIFMLWECVLESFRRIWLGRHLGPLDSSLDGQPRSNLSRTRVFMMPSVGIRRLCRKRQCRMQTRTITGM